MRTRSLVAATLWSLPLVALNAFACGADPGPNPVTPVAAGSASTASIASASPSIAIATLPSATPSAAAQVAPMSVDEAAMDKSVDPCDDFYQYACGSWLKNTPIPDDRAAWARSFHEIDERNMAKLHELLEHAASGSGGAGTQKIGDAYAACMDEPAVEKAGLDPIKDALGITDAITDKASVVDAIHKLYAHAYTPIFGFTSGQDFKDATATIAQVDQGGLGLPDRDDYLKKDPKSAEIRQKYLAHVAAMLKLSGLADDDAKLGAATVMNVETALAKASMTRVDRRDPKKVYHRMAAKDAAKLAPTLQFEKLVAALSVSATAPVNVAQPEFLKGLDAQLGRVKPADWKVYLRWHVIAEMAPVLTKAIVDEDFEFRLKTLQGRRALEPRWKRCVHSVDAQLGDALAEPFVRDNFGADGKATTLTMVGEIERSMEKDLWALGWMDEPTRRRALEKLHKINNKIGYPDRWRAYDTLTIVRTSHGANVMAASRFEQQRILAKIGRPLDRTEWLMTPPTVNAYYDPSMNEMVFPAGILQRPFFDRGATLAMNYGAIGMVIGHELTHGFDDEGRQFDGEGNLKEWWTKKVSSDFDKRTSCVVKQFDDYQVLPAMPATGDLKALEAVHVNGKLTLGENIADLGGLKLALVAMREARKSMPASAGAYSDDQQFFLSYAQAWCENVRPEMARQFASTDPHSPPRWRVIGPTSNMPEFATAFACKEKSKMVRAPADRCEVW